jgi:hypothetical protein
MEDPMQPRTTRRASALLLVVLGLTACGPVGSGDIVTETREVGDFDRIEISDGIVLEVAVDAGAGALVEAVYDDNLQERIVTEVDDGTLLIQGSGWGSFDALGSGRRVQVSIPALSGLVVSGGSRVVVIGVAEEMALRADGGANVDLSDLIVRTMHLTVSGGASATVNVTDAIDGEVSAGANLSVRGDPGSSDLEVSGGATLED